MTCRCISSTVKLGYSRVLPYLEVYIAPRFKCAPLSALLYPVYAKRVGLVTSCPHAAAVCMGLIFSFLFRPSWFQSLDYVAIYAVPFVRQSLHFAADLLPICLASNVNVNVPLVMQVCEINLSNVLRLRCQILTPTMSADQSTVTECVVQYYGCIRGVDDRTYNQEGR